MLAACGASEDEVDEGVGGIFRSVFVLLLIPIAFLAALVVTAGLVLAVLLLVVTVLKRLRPQQ